MTHSFCILNKHFWGLSTEFVRILLGPQENLQLVPFKVISRILWYGNHMIIIHLLEPTSFQCFFFFYRRSFLQSLLDVNWIHSSLYLWNVPIGCNTNAKHDGSKLYLTTGLVPNMHQACQDVFLLMSDVKNCIEDTGEVLFFVSAAVAGQSWAVLKWLCLIL